MSIAKLGLLDRLAGGLIGKSIGTDLPRSTSVGDLALVAITIAWMAIVRPPIVTDVLRSGPGWETFWLPVVVVLAISGIQPIVTFMRPHLVRFRSMVRIGTDLGFLALFAMSLNTGHWIELSDPANASARQAQLVIEINRWVGISLAIAIAILLVMTALELWRLVARQRTGTQVRQPLV